MRGRLPVRFVALSGKRVDALESEGLLVRLSMKEAEVILSTAIDAEDYGRARLEVRVRLGIDPDSIPDLRPAG